MKKYEKGSITVFLSLIMLLVLAVIMTTIEGARVNAASSLSLRALMTGLDSVMAEYYSPLYEEYHIFGLDAGYGSSEINQEKINENLNTYMEYTFKPDKDLTEDSINRDYLKFYGMQDLLVNTNFNNIQNLYGVNISSTTVEESTAILEYGGELFEKQALEYMKYKVPAETITSFVDNIAVLEDTNKSVEILEEKEKTDTKVLQLDEIILKLMELTDGITITKKGIKMKSGQIVVKGFFIKKFQDNPVTMNSSGMNNEWVFGTLKSHYRDVTGEIKGVISQVDTLNNLNSRIETVHNKIMSLNQIDTSKMTKEEKRAYNKEVKEANNQLNNLANEKSALIGDINSNVKTIKEQISGVLKVTEEAITVLNNGQSIQQEVTEAIVSYEQLVQSNKEIIGEEFYKGLKEGVEILAKYKGSTFNEESVGKEPLDYNNYDFSSMIQQLKVNELVLNNVLNILSISLSNSATSLVDFRTALSNSQTKMKQYNTNKLIFDYSTLTQPKDSEPFLNEIKKLVENGIMELVVEDYGSLSKKELDRESLPSDLLEKDPAVLKDILGLLESIDLEKGSNLLDNLLSDNIGQTATDLGERALNLILYQEYLNDHFGYFINEKEPEHKALNYELEYILKGNNKDVQNLSTVAMQILTTRTVLNIITLLADGTKANEAKLLAASFVGFTGMPLLVEAVKMIILTLWALMESLVDIAALLKDRAIPIFKTGKDIQIRLIEIMGMNKALIHKKALNYKELKTVRTLKYKDYIGLFLFMEYKEKKLYRAMDLIQENLQLKVGEVFYMKNCMTGLRVTGIFHMNPRFVSISFVNSYIEEDTGGYQYTFTREYTY